MEKRFIEWHPRHRNQFLVCSNRLELYNITPSENRSASLIKFIDGGGSSITCSEMYPHEHSSEMFTSMFAYGNISGSVYINDWISDRELNLTHRRSSSRACTGVSWNKKVPNQLAAAFDKLRKLVSFLDFIAQS